MKNKIVHQARTWIGTRFVHQGRLKKTEKHQGGCDCIGLVIGILKELNISQKFLDNINYPRLVKDSILLNNLENYLIKKDENNIRIGDIALFQFSQNLPPQHIGIISSIDDEFTIIHSYLKVGKVVEHLLDQTWKSYIHSLFEI